jgi:hypothetical protein
MADKKADKRAGLRITARENGSTRAGSSAHQVLRPKPRASCSASRKGTKKLIKNLPRAASFCQLEGSPERALDQA